MRGQRTVGQNNLVNALVPQSNGWICCDPSAHARKGQGCHAAYNGRAEVSSSGLQLALAERGHFLYGAPSQKGACLVGPSHEQSTAPGLERMRCVRCGPCIGAFGPAVRYGDPVDGKGRFFRRPDHPDLPIVGRCLLRGQSSRPADAPPARFVLRSLCRCGTGRDRQSSSCFRTGLSAFALIFGSSAGRSGPARYRRAVTHQSPRATTPRLKRR